jgi:hypothetical protein
MKTLTTQDVLQWIQHAIANEQFDPPSDELCAFIATCDVCKGALALLLTSAFDVPHPTQTVSMQQCQDDLAAYIDIEYAEGTAPALREYPHVWWHLWTSPELAETYRLTRLLAAAEQPGSLPSLALPLPAHRHTPRMALPQVHISGSFLQRTFASRQLLGMARGADNDDPLMVEEKTGGSMFHIDVQPDDAETWNVIVTVNPPVAGCAVLTRGETILEAALNEQGVAVIAAVPEALLTMADDSDLVVRLRTEDADV